jgi:perosamine synthetase
VIGKKGRGIHKEQVFVLLITTTPCILVQKITRQMNPYNTEGFILHSCDKPVGFAVKMIPRKKFDIGWLDLLFGMWYCLNPQPDHPKARRKCEQVWSNGGGTLACLSVRSGFYATLQALNFPEGSEFLCSAVTIGDMAKILKAHGIVPVPVDMDMNELSIDGTKLGAYITGRTRGILVAHLFGSLVPMDPVIAFARKHKLFVFEDCAQAFAGFDYRGHPGSNVVMFSFGPIKTSTALGGALFHYVDPDLRNIAERIQSCYPFQKTTSFFFRLLKYCFLKAVINPFCFAILYRICRLRGTTHDRIVGAAARGFAGPDFFSRIRRQPCSALSMLLRRRLLHFNPATVANRKRNAEFFISLLPAIQRPGINATRPTHWVFPVESDSPDRFIGSLWEQGLDATRGASNMAALNTPENRPFRKPVNACSTMSRVVYLPVYEKMKTTALRKLAKAVYRFNKHPKARPSVFLVRHGKPAIWCDPDYRYPLPGRMFAKFLADYDASGIDAGSLPKKGLVELMKSVHVVFCSSSVRAVESAEFLSPMRQFEIEPLFREADFPSGYWNGVSLPPIVWMVVGRILWRLGFSPNAEPFNGAQCRAGEAAYMLHTAALQEQRVMLVGHGMMNMLIRKELCFLGWKHQLGINASFWGCHHLSW